MNSCSTFWAYFCIHNSKASTHIMYQLFRYFVLSKIRFFIHFLQLTKWKWLLVIQYYICSFSFINFFPLAIIGIECTLHTYTHWFTSFITIDLFQAIWCNWMQKAIEMITQTKSKRPFRLEIFFYHFKACLSKMNCTCALIFLHITK